MIKVKINPLDNKLIMEFDNITDEKLNYYRDKIFLFPYIYEDGNIVVKFYYNEKNVFTEITKNAHLYSYINFEHFFQYMINCIEKQNDIILSVNEYFNFINDTLNNSIEVVNKLCPCCQTPILEIDGFQYCVNADCSQYNFVETLLNKLNTILDDISVDPETINYIISNILKKLQKPLYTDTLDINVMNNINLCFIIEEIFKIKMLDKNLKLSLAKSILNIPIWKIFKLFKIPNPLCENVLGFLHDSFLIQLGVPESIQLLCDTVYKFRVNNEQISYLEPIDTYIKHSVSINDCFLNKFVSLVNFINSIYDRID